jgi:pimeloyl-ACP methyl ester carboxylesterase
VHGWRMPASTWFEFSESMFKRLYWQGYQGGFASLFWPTRSTDTEPHPLDFVTYNRSEHIAFESASGTAAYLNDLRSRFPDSQISVAAHSMGNIVMMETMKQLATAHQKPINNYVLMQAAVPAQCYDGSATNSAILQLVELLTGSTPNTYSNYASGVTNALRTGGKMINFCNTNDFALSSWVLNESFVFPRTNDVITMKPNTYLGYYTDGINSSLKTNDLNTSVASGLGYILGFFTGDSAAAWYYDGPTRTVTAPHELMPFVSRPRTLAVGAQPGVHGVIGAELDLQASFGFTGADYDHSGEFNRNIQDPVIKPFYPSLIDNLFPPPQ